MRQEFIVSRRKLVALAAGAAAMSASPAAAAARQVAASSSSWPPPIFAASRQRVLRELDRVRRAPGRAGRAEAFASLAAAVRAYDMAAFSSDGASCARRGNGAAATITALYHGREPEAVLAAVIVRELEALPMQGTAWMTRFADLEAVIRTQPG